MKVWLQRMKWKLYKIHEDEENLCNLNDVEYNFLLRVWDKDNTRYGIESLIFPIFHTDSKNLQTICQTLRKFQPISI